MNTQRIQRYFSPLIIIFLLIVAAVAGIIFYLAFSKTIITVTVHPSTDRYDFSYTASDLDANVVNVPIDTTYRYTDTAGVAAATASTETGIAKGTVTIENRYSADQPLVKTTRLLSDSGVLFRTAETVTVPAGGSVTVPVYADQAGASGDIAPARFEIVALWAGLKDKIYATSNSAMTGGVVYRTVVTDEMLQAAQQSARTAALSDAHAMVKQKIQTTATGLTPETMNSVITAQTTSPQIGEPTDVVTVRTTGTVTGIGFDLAKLTDLIEQDTDQTIDPTTITYTTTVPTDGTEASITGSIAVTPIEPSLDFIDLARLTNKTVEEVNEYIGSFKSVQQVSITFNPFWLTHTPTLTRQIQLKMYVAGK